MSEGVGNKIAMGLMIGIASLLGAYVVAFGLYNGEPVNVDLILSQHEMPLWSVAAIFFAAGVFVMGVLTVAQWFRHVRARRATSRRIAALNEELKRLRNAPIDAPAQLDEAGADLPIKA